MSHIEVDKKKDFTQKSNHKTKLVYSVSSLAVMINYIHMILSIHFRVKTYSWNWTFGAEPFLNPFCTTGFSLLCKTLEFSSDGNNGDVGELFPFNIKGGIGGAFVFFIAGGSGALAFVDTGAGGGGGGVGGTLLVDGISGGGSGGGGGKYICGCWRCRESLKDSGKLASSTGTCCRLLHKWTILWAHSSSSLLVKSLTSFSLSNSSLLEFKSGSMLKFVSVVLSL